MADDKLYNRILGVLRGSVPRRSKVKTGPLSTPQLVAEGIAHRVLDKRLPRHKQLMHVRNACTQMEHRGLVKSKMGGLTQRVLIWESVEQK